MSDATERRALNWVFYFCDVIAICFVFDLFLSVPFDPKSFSFVANSANGTYLLLGLGLYFIVAVIYHAFNMNNDIKWLEKRPQLFGTFELKLIFICLYIFFLGLAGILLFSGIIGFEL